MCIVRCERYNPNDSILVVGVTLYFGPPARTSGRKVQNFHVIPRVPAVVANGQPVSVTRLLPPSLTTVVLCTMFGPSRMFVARTGLLRSAVLSSTLRHVRVRGFVDYSAKYADKLAKRAQE